MNDCQMISIFGAQSRAKTLKGYLSVLYPNMRIQSFLVDDEEQNDEEIDGIPVQKLEQAELKYDVPVYIATKGIYHEKITQSLQEKGAKHIIPVTVELDNVLRNEYVKKQFEKTGRNFSKIENMSCPLLATQTEVKSAIYMAKSIYDKPLSKEVEVEEYIIPIQVGAALTEQHLEGIALTDATVTNGNDDHISERNRQYSELTALYWMWKHAEEDVVGLCHYRRHFVLPKDWLTIMQEQGIDVILPVPTYVAPNIADNYRERHDASDWEFLMELLKSDYSEDYCKAEQVFAGNLYSPCNMFIARKEVMDELCAWMFPILFAVQEHGGEKEDVYQNRYLGFVSERLITLFFEKNYEKYRIVYADKTFVS